MTPAIVSFSSQFMTRLYLAGALHVAGGSVATVRAAIAVGRLYVQETRGKRLVAVPALRLAGRRSRTQRVPVITAVTGDELVPARLSVLAMVLAGYLESRVVRLGAAVREEYDVLVAQPLVQLLCQLDGGFVALDQRIVRHSLQLLVGDPRQLFATVAGVDGPLAGHTVQVAVAFAVGDPGSVGLRYHHRRGIRVVSAHSMPDVFLVLLCPILCLLHQQPPQSLAL